MNDPGAGAADGTGCRPLRRLLGTDASEIVVCSRREDGYRLKEMPSTYEEEPLRAEKLIGGGATARAYVEQVEMPGGQISKRAMIGVRWPF